MALVTLGLGPNNLLVTLGLGGSGGPILSFYVGAAAPIGPLAVRVTFSTAPKAFDPADATDALHVAGYALAGPTAATVVAAAPVTGDASSIDLFLGAPLPAGTWTVTVSSGVKGLLGQTLIDPRSAAFQVVVNPNATPVSGGAVNEGILRKHLNPALRGDAWDHLILAVEGDADHVVGDTYVSQFARAARDQLFLASASGEYLDQRAGEADVRRPDGVGMSDDDFRRLAIALSSDALTHHAINDLLEVFYSSDATRATATTTLTEPFALQDGDDLVLLFGEERSVTVRLDQRRFARIATATAAEVAAAIGQALDAAGVHGLADAIPDPATGAGHVRVYADARGTPSSVRVLGGRAQVGLRFPGDVFPTVDLTPPYGTWSIAPSPTTPGNVRFTSVGASAYDLSLVQPGDLLLLYGREFPAALLGTAEVLAVSVTYPLGVLSQWVEVAGAAVTATVTQVTANDLVFQRPVLRTLLDQPFPAYPAETGDGIEVVLPVTTQVVTRTDQTGAYPAQATALEISAVDRDAAGVVTITTAAAHGLAPGDRVLVDGVAFAPALPAVTAGTPSGSLGASHL